MSGSERTLLHRRVSLRPASTPTTTSAANPFPGPRPFTEDEAGVFFGRSREVEHLLGLLTVERATLVHAQSGSGKSSLVNASLVPHARDHGFEVLPVARVWDPPGSGSRQSTSRYVENVLANWREGAAVAAGPGASTLLEFLEGLGSAAEPGRIIVFDQFEELFLYPESWRDRAELFRQIQASLDSDPLLRVLLVLRDDYLARLEPFTRLLRDRLRARYAIVGLDAAQAMDATVEPFRSAGMHFAPGAADAMVRGLLLQPPEDPAAPPYEGEHVEPVQLQIVCRTLFDRLAEREPAVHEISVDDVETYADVEQALAGFYDEAVTAAARTGHRMKERQIRLWFERRLITPSKARNRVLRETDKTAGLPNVVIDELEQRRVIHADARGPDRWYELTHDRLVDAVLTSNRAWLTSSIGRERPVLLWALIVGLVPVLALAAVLFSRHNRSGSQVQLYKSGQVVSAGASQPFPFDVKAGQLLTAFLKPGGDLKGHLELTGPAGSAIAASADALNGSAFLTTRVTEAGEHQLVASGREQTSGDFALTIVRQTVDVYNRRIEAGTPESGSIATPDEVDVYTFNATKGSAARITMEGRNGLDGTVVLVLPGGTAVSDDDSGGSGDPALALILPETGTYSLRASSSGTTTGSYRLRVEFPDVARLDASAAGDVNPQNPVQLYAIRVPDGGLASIRLVPEPGLNGRLRLLQVDGTVLEDRDNEGAGVAETLVSPLVPDATYLLMVASAEASKPGSFSLTMTVRAPVALDTRSRSGDLRPGDRGEVYRINGEGGQVATISVAGDPALRLRVDVFGPDGASIVKDQATRDGEELLFAARLADPGPYLVAVTPGLPTSPEHSTGRYTLSVSRITGTTRAS